MAGVSQRAGIAGEVPGPPPGLGPALMVLGVVLAADGLVFLAGTGIRRLMGGGGTGLYMVLLLTATLAMGAALLLPGVGGYLRGQVRWSEFRRGRPWREVAAALAVVAAAQVGGAWLLYPAGKPITWVQFRAAMAGGDWPWLALYAAVVVGLAPPLEEALFRGLLFRMLRERWGYWAGALLSSALFALLHGLRAAPVIFVLALTSCRLYERSRNLAGCILVHAANNLGVLAAFVWTARMAP